MFKGTGMKLKYLLLAAISGAIITIDQASKMYVHTHFSLHESVEILKNFFNITYVRNEGAAFGFLAESHPMFREMFFLSMPPIALLIILAILRNVAERDRWTIVSLSMVFGGAIGNYIDRLRFRFVVDFLDFYVMLDPNALPPKRYVWPAFNIADMAIVVGVGILIFLEFTKDRVTDEVPTEQVNAS
jgi:signal peptidase II